VFTYYPAGDERRGRWFVTLSTGEIDAIADGTMREIDLYCCVSQECRTKFREPDEMCCFCDYEENDETQRFKAQLKALAHTVRSKEEWIDGYLKLRPDATGIFVIADYNPIDGLGERLGWFSVAEADELIRKVRSPSGEPRAGA
jgi:hypothetical protein